MITATTRRSLQSQLTGGHLYLPAGTYYVDTPLIYDTSKNGPITISGDGASTKLVSRSVSIVLRISGRMGFDLDLVRIMGLQCVNGGLHLEGVAGYSVRDLYVTGDMPIGLHMTGSQQGEIAGGFIGRGVKDGIVFETLPSGVASNGADLHGMSMMCEQRNIVISRVDSFFMRGCHSALSRIGVDVVAPGYGPLNVTDSHFELHADASIRCRSSVRIARNTFFSPPGSIDIDALEGSSSITDNLIQGELRIAQMCEDVRIVDNKLVGMGRVSNLGQRTLLRDNR